MYQLNGTAWEYVSDATNYSYTEILQANYDIYTNDTLSTVLFTATHSDHIPLMNRNDEPLYYIDDTYTGMTTTVTALPVYVYVYDELTKLKISFETIDGKDTPIITWGAGAGVEGHPDWGKAFDYKETNGIVRKYIKETNGEEVKFKVGENGIEGPGIATIYSNTNSEQKTITTTPTIILSRELGYNLNQMLIDVSFEITLTGACKLTAETYIDTTALEYKPTMEYPAGTYTFSYNDIARYIPQDAGAITIQVSTDANSGTIEIGQAVLTIQTFAGILPSVLNPTSLGAVAQLQTQINLSWTNPMSTSFIGVELYRSTSDLAGKTRAYCNANATLMYEGSGTSYNDTGLTAETLYYYRIFAKYNISGAYYYSGGVDASTTTLPTYTYLYNLGDECTAITGGWTKRFNRYSSAQGVLTKNVENMRLDSAYYSGYTNTTGAGTTNLIDFTNYSKLFFQVDSVITITAGADIGMSTRFGVVSDFSSSNTGSGNTFTYETAVYTITKKELGTFTYTDLIVEIDIASLTSGYVAFDSWYAMTPGLSGTVIPTVKKIWLVR
jgi:hypothetical protein